MITATFDVPGMTADQYDAVMQRLSDAGQDAPAGRLLHVASDTPQGWQVVDVWESSQQLETFAGTLMPILVEIVGTPPQPDIRPTHALVTA